MKLYFLIFSILLFGLQFNADANIYSNTDNAIGKVNSTYIPENKWIKKNNDSNEVLVSYDQGGKYFVEKFFVPKNQYQRKAFSKVFSDSKRRMSWLKNYLQKNNEFKKSNENITFDLQQHKLSTTNYIWQSTETWSEDWEMKYTEWVAQNGQIDFLEKYNIATDCADVAYTYRWIFAYINKLPMANRLGGTRQIFSNQSFLKKWKNLPRSQNWWEDQVFRAALEYLMDNTYTHTLIDDSYPIEISTAAMRPGVHHLEIRPHSGHTMLLTKTNFTQDGDVLTLIYSDVPRMVRKLYQSGYWYMQQPTDFKKGGFLRMRWYVQDSNKSWNLLNANKHPYYSLEQYAPEFMNGEDYFNDAVQIKLSAYYNSPEGKVKRLINRIVNLAWDRIYIVIAGNKKCIETNCKPGDEVYEAWSTPSRDARFLAAFEMLYILLQNANDPALYNYWQRVRQDQFGIIYDEQWQPIVSISIAEAEYAFVNKLISSDPRDSIEKRWGK